MKIKSEVETKWIDPLTFSEMKIDERVTLKSDSGIVTDFIIDNIYDDNSILLKKPDGKIISSVNEKSFTLHPSITLDAKTLRPNDLVQIRVKNGKIYQLRVELIFNKYFLILGPVGASKRLSFLNKLKLFWK